MLNLILNLMLMTGPQAGKRLDGSSRTLRAVAITESLVLVLGLYT